MRRGDDSGFAVRMEIWSLVCTQGALLFSAGLAQVATVFLGEQAGWGMPPATADERLWQSPLGYGIIAAYHALGALTLLAIAWRLRRLSLDAERNGAS